MRRNSTMRAGVVAPDDVDAVVAPGSDPAPRPAALADRVDAVEEHVKSFANVHPDNPIIGTGIQAAFTHHRVSSRIARQRTCLVHQPLDPVIVARPWVAAAGAAIAGGRALVRSRAH